MDKNKPGPAPIYGKRMSYTLGVRLPPDLIEAVEQLDEHWDLGGTVDVVRYLIREAKAQILEQGKTHIDFTPGTEHQAGKPVEVQVDE
jgi:hypothetical protein